MGKGLESRLLGPTWETGQVLLSTERMSSYRVGHKRGPNPLNSMVLLGISVPISGAYTTHSPPQITHCINKMQTEDTRLLFLCVFAIHPF